MEFTLCIRRVLGITILLMSKTESGDTIILGVGIGVWKRGVFLRFTLGLPEVFTSSWNGAS